MTHINFYFYCGTYFFIPFESLVYLDLFCVILYMYNSFVHLLYIYTVVSYFSIIHFLSHCLEYERQPSITYCLKFSLFIYSLLLWSAVPAIQQVCIASFQKKTAQSGPHFWGWTVSTQFAQQSARTSHQAFVLRHNLKDCPGKLKQTAYFSLIHSFMMYGATVWEPYKKCNSDKVERVQHRAARFVKSRYSR